MQAPLVNGLAKRIASLLDARERRTIDVAEFHRAAVLIPILERKGGPTVLFTRRAETVSHPGQISFPGGHFEPDEDAPAAALRESREEVGLASSAVAVAGLLDDRLSISKVIVTPVVGVVDTPPDAFVRQESEVLEPFEVPLSVLLDPRIYRMERWDARHPPPGWTEEESLRLRRQFQDLDPETETFPMHFYDCGNGRVVWGLTAQILHQLLALVFTAR